MNSNNQEPDAQGAQSSYQSEVKTNVIRVPFGVRRARRVRPKQPAHWATLVLPLQLVDTDPTPPQAA